MHFFEILSELVLWISFWLRKKHNCNEMNFVILPYSRIIRTLCTFYRFWLMYNFFHFLLQYFIIDGNNNIGGGT